MKESYLADAVNLTRIRRVLVIKLRHFGDVLLTSPVFTTLARQIPDVEIDALVYAETAPMLTGNQPGSHYRPGMEKAGNTNTVAAGTLADDRVTESSL
jgi:hypothetical protein